MRCSCFTLLGLCAFLALSLAGCGRGASPTSPASAMSRSAGFHPAGLTAGADGDAGTTPTPSPPGRDDAPPLAQILDPQPSAFLAHFFDASQPVTVRWTATDPDGPGPGVKSFRYIVLDLSDPANQTFLFDPDSLLARDGPAFANWTEVDGRVDQVTLEGLTINNPYVLYVIAFDRRGEHDEHLELKRNGLMFALELNASPARTQAGSLAAPPRNPHGDESAGQPLH